MKESMRRAVLILLGSLLGYAALEGLIFHNLYASIIRPDSSAGNVETFIDNELRRARTDANQVLGIGDSRLQGALMPRVANQLRSETGYTFANISTAGSTPRCWYYMLRDVDPAANRYSAIVISVDSYDDAETWEDFADRQTDLHYMIARLRLSDLFEFSGSYHDPQRKWEAFRGILVKGLVYKQDFQHFLLRPALRLAYVKQSRRESVHWFYDYVGSAEDMQGVEVDFAAHTLKIPPDRLAQKPGYEEAFLNPLPPYTGRRGAYLRYWLGKIQARYRGSGTRLVFLRFPRGPVVRPDQPPVIAHSSVRDLAAYPEVTLLPEHFFDSLERPELFLDQLHLNRTGSDQFSAMLAREMRELLGPPR